MSKTFKIVGQDISDGYHTFDELYEHRVLLFINLVLTMPEKAAYKRDFETWSAVYLELPTGQISYHIPNDRLRLIEHVVKEVPDYKWDGHTAKLVEERLWTHARKHQDGV